MTEYDPHIWFQTSRKHRRVARLPEGQTGKQALSAHDKRLAERLHDFGAAQQYVACYAERDGNCATLTQEQFEAFRAAGGSNAGAMVMGHRCKAWETIEAYPLPCCIECGKPLV